jgi:DNA primase
MEPGLTLEDFKARLPIVDVVGRWVRLKPRARHDFWGCCPFHNEKTPSFHVRQDKGIYHCFGCGAHGNAIDFVMAVEHVEFAEALDRLGELTGLPAPRREVVTKPKVEPGLFEALAEAGTWFERNLRSPPGRAAASYLERRGVAPALAARFRLGYAPAERQAMKSALIAAGIGEPMLLRAGLLVQPEDGGTSFDRFRDRLMFPIADARGRIVGFGGRALGEAKAKYLNSPETELFHKGSLLYGLPDAARAVRAAGTLLVVEGYMDVIGLARAGMDHAVAPLGTALTEEQLEELWRHTPEPVLCFDGDAAGLRAAQRAADRALPLLRPNRSLRFVLLPAGEDPDSIVARQGAAAMQVLLSQPTTLVDFLWEQATAGVPLDTPERRVAVERGLMARLATIGDRDLRAHYRRELGGRLRELWRPRGRAAMRVAGQTATGRLAVPVQSADRRAEEALLEPFLLAPQLLEQLEEELARLVLLDTELERLRCEILAWYAGAPPLDAEQLRAHLTRHDLEPLVEHILRLRLSARVVSRFGDEDDVHEAWRLAAARHSRSVARRMESPGSEGVEEQQAEVIAHIGTLIRLLEKGKGRADEPGSSAGDA